MPTVNYEYSHFQTTATKIRSGEWMYRGHRIRLISEQDKPYWRLVIFEQRDFYQLGEARKYIDSIMETLQ